MNNLNKFSTTHFIINLGLLFPNEIYENLTVDELKSLQQELTCLSLDFNEENIKNLKITLKYFYKKYNMSMEKYCSAKSFTEHTFPKKTLITSFSVNLRLIVLKILLKEYEKSIITGDISQAKEAERIFNQGLLKLCN
jgi:hypothetical protein